MSTARTLTCVIGLVILGSISGVSKACMVVYTDHDLDLAEAELEAWVLVGDYYHLPPCNYAAYQWGPFWHSYEASVTIESPTQAIASGESSLPLIPYGGGYTEAFAAISILDDPGTYVITSGAEILCTAVGILLQGILQEFVEVPRLIFLDINRHTSTPLEETEVDVNILQDANSRLQTNDGPGDVACPIALVRNGPIETFPYGDGILRNQADLDAVYAEPGRVKVVNEIRECSGPPPPGTITGCSGGIGMIVRRYTPSLEGVIWVHEYGHNQYLWLNHGDDEDFFSYHTMQTSMKRVNQFQCDALRNPLN